ncbi:hypothetical protein Mgra_00000211 [Meloidogyne graminicola]|uniref:Plus3 domain-containing protein n=1 Tax=Meloidogyne graminicola TaxID=189291 RepID=A0A8T0A2S3_9BILA|nr:hypothetical protein Mgra_00000211 [Meloidogyne graminicola]
MRVIFLFFFCSKISKNFSLLIRFLLYRFLILKMDRHDNLDLFEEVRYIHELDPIVLSRSKLIRLAEKLENFEEIVKKCYVRILTKTDKLTFHAIYRIIGVKDTQVPIGKSKYAKRILVDNQAERILESVSTDQITQEEFDVWYRNAKLKDQPLPTLTWIKKRANELHSALSEAPKRSEITTAGELEKIILSRSRLIHLILSKEGESLLEGCFVRMVLGHERSTGQVKYGVAQIVEITESDEYEVTEPVGSLVIKHKLYRKLTLRHVSNTYVEVGLQSISNSPIDGAEFFEWSTAYYNANLPLPVVDFVEKKEQQIHQFLRSKGLILKRVKKEEPVDDEPALKIPKDSRSRDMFGQ